jgi:hypothetical protein
MALGSGSITQIPTLIAILLPPFKPPWTHLARLNGNSLNYAKASISWTFICTLPQPVLNQDSTKKPWASTCISRLCSAHPPGILTSLIIGMTKRIYALTTELDDWTQSFRLLFLRLCNRGYGQATLRPLLEIAIKKAHTKKLATIDFDKEKRCYLHLSYHPQDPSSTVIQKTFRNTLLWPSGEPSLPELRSFRGYPLETNLMVIAYHRPHNLKNLLFPRTFKEHDDKPVSSFIPAPLATGT